MVTRFVNLPIRWVRPLIRIPTRWIISPVCKREECTFKSDYFDFVWINALFSFVIRKCTVICFPCSWMLMILKFGVRHDPTVIRDFGSFELKFHPYNFVDLFFLEGFIVTFKSIFRDLIVIQYSELSVMIVAMLAILISPVNAKIFLSIKLVAFKPNACFKGDKACFIDVSGVDR